MLCESGERDTTTGWKGEGERPVQGLGFEDFIELLANFLE